MIAANTEKPSKSARKREYLALQDLGEALTRLRPAELEALPLDERLMDAVLEARGLHSRGALRRQRQLIGKLMRSADAPAIRAALGGLGQGDRQATRLFHAAETWRDRICSEGPPAIAELATGSNADTVTLRRLADDLAAANDEDRRRSLKRKIFREVHAALARAPEVESR
jgi:ribosome-associated protein